jgi:drug/metabolite transporter (DMT)-like permease
MSVAASAPAGAALLMLASVASTATQNCLIRMAADSGIHAFEVVLFRNVFGLLSVAAVIVLTERGIPRTHLAVLIGLACILHVASMMAGFLAVALLPLNDSTALSFAGPLFTTVGAALFLGETVRVRRWIAVAAGFAGVLIILRPGIVAIEFGAVMMLLATVLGAAVTLMFKRFAGGERATTLILYQTAFSALLSVPPTAPVWTAPDAAQALLLATIGILGTVSWLAFLRAFTLADASAVMPYEFARLPFVAVLAYLIYGETPDLWTWIGAAVVFASNIFIAHREVAAHRAAARGGKGL